MSQYESEFFLLFSSQGHTRWTDEGGKLIQMILKKIGVLARTNLTVYCEKMLNLSIFILCPSFFFMYKRMKWVTIVFCAHQASLVSWFVPTLSHKRRSRGSVHEHDNAIAWKKEDFFLLCTTTALSQLSFHARFFWSLAAHNSDSKDWERKKNYCALWRQVREALFPSSPL